MPRFHFASIESAKSKAKSFRKAAQAESVAISLTKSQAIMARLYGYRDWNELSKVTQAKTAAPTSGDHVQFDLAILTEALEVGTEVAARILGSFAPGFDSHMPSSKLIESPANLIAAHRFENHAEIMNAVRLGRLIIVTGAVQPTLGVLHDHMRTLKVAKGHGDPLYRQASPGQPATIQFIEDFKAEEVNPSKLLSSRNSNILIGMAADGPLDAVSKLMTYKTRRMSTPPIIVLEVGAERNPDGTLPCKVTNCSNLFQSPIQFIESRPLARHGSFDIDLATSSKARKQLVAAAVSRSSIFIWSSNDEIRENLMRRRVMAAPDVACHTTEILGAYARIPNRDSTTRSAPWMPVWRKSEVIFSPTPIRQSRAESIKYVTDAMTDEDLQAALSRSIVLVSAARVDAPCPHCATTMEKAWVFGEDAHTIRSIFTAEQLRSEIDGRRILFAQPLGCEACDHTGFLGSTTVADIWTPSASDFRWILDSRHEVPASRPEYEAESMGGEGLHMEALQLMLDGKVDPMEWLRRARFEFDTWKQAYDSKSPNTRRAVAPEFQQFPVKDDWPRYSSKVAVDDGSFWLEHIGCLAPHHVTYARNAIATDPSALDLAARTFVEAVGSDASMDIDFVEDIFDMGTEFRDIVQSGSKDALLKALGRIEDWRRYVSYGVLYFAVAGDTLPEIMKKLTVRGMYVSLNKSVILEI